MAGGMTGRGTFLAVVGAAEVQANQAEPVECLCKLHHPGSGG